MGHLSGNNNDVSITYSAAGAMFAADAVAVQKFRASRRAFAISPGQ